MTPGIAGSVRPDAYDLFDAPAQSSQELSPATGLWNGRQLQMFERLFDQCFPVVFRLGALHIEERCSQSVELGSGMAQLDNRPAGNMVQE